MFGLMRMMLGVPMVPVVAKTGRGLEALLDTVIAVYENRDPRVRHIHINNGPVVEQALRPLYERLRSDRDELPKHFPPRYFAMKLLERDKEVEAQLADLAAKKTERGIIITLGDVLFGTDQSNLTPDGMRSAQKLAEVRRIIREFGASIGAAGCA